MNLVFFLLSLLIKKSQNSLAICVLSRSTKQRQSKYFSFFFGQKREQKAKEFDYIFRVHLIRQVLDSHVNKIEK